VTEDLKVLKGKVNPLNEESYKAWPKKFLDEMLSILEYKVFQQAVHPEFQASYKANLKPIIRMFQDRKRRKVTSFLDMRNIFYDQVVTRQLNGLTVEWKYIPPAYLQRLYPYLNKEWAPWL